MADHNARIIVTADAAGVKATTDELVRMGKVDKENADKFKKHSEERHHLINEGIDLNTKLTRSFEELGEGIIAAFAVEKIIEFGAECIKAFSEAEQAASQLEFAVKNIAKSGEEGLSELNEQTEELSKKTGNFFSEKDIKKAQTRLIELGYTVDETQRLLERVADIAAQKGVNLEDMAVAVTTAFEGSSRGLKKLGIEMPITGESIQDLNRFFKESEQYQGALQQAMETTAGKTRMLDNSLEKLQENAGKNLTFWQSFKQGLFAESPSRSDDYNSLLDEKAAAAANEIKEEERNDKAIEDLKKKHQLDLTRLTMAELNTRLQATIEGDLKTIKEQDDTQNVLEELKEAGLQKEQQRIQKEIEERKRRSEKILSIEKELQAQLIQIIKQIRDIEGKSDLDTITDKYEQEKAAQELAFQKQLETVKEQREKLNEIIKKGNSKQREIAKKELQETDIEEGLIIEANAVKRSELDKKHALDRIKLEQEKNAKLSELNKISEEDILEDAKKKLYDQYKAELITKEEYDKKLKVYEDSVKIDDDQRNIENIKKERDQVQSNYDSGLINKEDFDKSMLDLEVKYQEALLQLKKDSNKKAEDEQEKSKDKQKEFLKDLKEANELVFESINESIQSNIEAIDTQAERQNKMIDYQKTLAEKGLANDLAFEERRADELEKKKLQEQEKLKKAKELETFLNSLAKYAEENPNTAVAKALGVLAASKAVEAVYAEEGGIMGQTGHRSFVGSTYLSRRHPGGGDILIHGKKGEGIIPEPKMREWGLTDMGKFSSFLRTPFSEKLLPTPKPYPVFNDAKIIERLESLEATIKNKSEFSMDVNQLNEWVTREVRNGVKTVTTHRRRI